MAGPHRRLILRTTGAWLTVAGLVGCGQTAAPAFKGVDITGAEYARDFELPDTEGRVRHLADFKGKVTVVFFGFTQCADVCPTTMLELAEVKKALGAEGPRVQGVFITIDPDRDTPEVLKGYLQTFSPDFVALRGSAEQTQGVARQFKVYYAKVPGKAPGTYTMDHSAGSYIFDARGKVRVYARYGSGAEALQNDLKLLLAQG
jgi:protein SCO1/2